jgi:hypothetical protein
MKIILATTSTTAQGWRRTKLQELYIHNSACSVPLLLEHGNAHRKNKDHTRWSAFARDHTCLLQYLDLQLHGDDELVRGFSIRG